MLISSNKLLEYYMLYIYKETIVIWKTINLKHGENINMKCLRVAIKIK